MALALFPEPKNLILRGQKIRQDAEGRYFLNDVLKISGLGKHKAPGNWIRTEMARDLAAEISQDANMRLGNTEPFKIVHGGINAGTYACREMVIAYSCWLNAKFHLAVIRAFDEMMSGGRLKQVPLSPPRYADGRLVPMKVRFRQLREIALECGYDKDQADVFASNGIEKHYGYNPLADMRIIPGDQQ